MTSTDSRVQFKWTEDRHNGYSRCTIKVDEKTFGSASGGGYSLDGVALSKFIARRFPEDLKRLETGDGLYFYYNREAIPRWRQNCKIVLNGAEGFDSMKRILEKLGYELVFEKEMKASKFYKLRRI